MRFWLAKSEPGTYSWEDLQRDKQTSWEGVRNYQARNNLREMRKGDQVFFYHSGEDKAVVGLMEVASEAIPDPTAEAGEDWVTVGMKILKSARHRLSLKEMKADPAFENMLLIRNSRISVSPVSDAEARKLLTLTGMQR